MTYRFPNDDSREKFYNFMRNYQISYATAQAALTVLKATVLSTPTSVTGSQVLIENMALSPPALAAFNLNTRFPTSVPPASPAAYILKNSAVDELFNDLLFLLALPEPIFGQDEWNQLLSTFTKYIDLANPRRMTVDRAYFEQCLGIIYA